ncbi:MAG TPA: hypothetical protein VF179_24115 [Thermoanaerobaculia bacterium]|nr:hypothetical protein [Thermoanaerobaculia bacterium]
MPDFRDLFGRVSQTHLRFVEGVAQLAVNHARSVVDICTDLFPVQPKSADSAAAHATGEASASRSTAGAVPVLVLEAEAGELAYGVFLVNNQLTGRVSAPVEASAFVDPMGHEFRPPVTIEPQMVTLDPGEQCPVRISVLVSEDLVAGVSYRAEISIPGLSESRVPVVLRRRTAASPAPG